MTDMKDDTFAGISFGSAGKAALSKMKDLPDNFRLYEVGYVEDRPEDFRVIKVVGAEFREAKAGPNKGLLSIKIPGTERSACVTPEECAEFKSDLM